MSWTMEEQGGARQLKLIWLLSFELSIAWFWPEDFTPSECLFDGNFKEEMAAPFHEDIKAMKRWVKFWCPQGKCENWLFVVLAAWKSFSACK